MDMRQATKLRRPSKLFKENSGDIKLHKMLDEYDIERIRLAFVKEENGELNMEQLQKLLTDVTRTTFDLNTFEMLFLRMNIKRDGWVDWDEFISYLILCFKDDEVPTEFKDLDPPISKPPRMLRSNHRHPINRILFSPTVKPDRSKNWTEGSYMSSSKDGVINYWSLDLQLERSVQSTCPELKVQQTWVTDMVCLPDVSVVCTSSTERDLRFYDTSAQKFELRVMFTSLEYAVCTMYYQYSENIEEDSMLIVGDMNGNIKVIFFPPAARGPFKSTPGIPLLNVRYEMVARGMMAGFRVIEFKGIHSDWVRQISYYHTLHSFVSCSGCERAGLSIKDFTGKTNYIYNQPKGIWCFDIDENAHLIATGGPDCLVRVWNTFVPRRPTIVFTGHHAGILSLIFQEGSRTLCSISNDKCIKVWDVPAQVCLQSYLGLPPELGERTDLTYLYNPECRQIILGNLMLASVYLCPLQSGEHTDGNTHSLAISCMLYNPLFSILLTCGLDSFIIVWDPWKGRQISVVKEAHTRMLHGEEIPVEITAATFDPGYQLLLTGAHDGSLKIWDFNTGSCLRNMHVDVGSEITSVIWVKGRILAVGWNKRITEFADSGGAAGPGGAFSKTWQMCHTDDILSSAARIPQSLATASYNGELVLWRLETGQPYKQYDVYNPMGRIKIKYQTQQSKLAPRKASATALAAKKTMLSKEPQMLSGPRKRWADVQVPSTCVTMKGLAIRVILFLSTREMQPGVGTLLVGVDNGSVQVWSHHVSGGFITAFWVAHAAGDYVISMATDDSNEYLFTGLCSGYIKIFLMKGYQTGEKENICMPHYRLIFPFMWNDLIDGRAKRANREQARPVLLNSFKAHRMIVTALIYLEQPEIIFSASADYSARAWSLGGRYLGTIGTFKPWVPLNPHLPILDTHNFVPMPPDIRRVASSTTYKVLVGGMVEKKLTKKQEQKKAETEQTCTDTTMKGVFGKRAEFPILGNCFRLPVRKTHFPNFLLDTSFPYIPVYQHLIRPAPIEFNVPKNAYELGNVQDIINNEEEEKADESVTSLSINELPDFV